MIARTQSHVGGERIDTRNCYVSDAELARQAEAFAKWNQAEEDHSTAALVWWVVVCIASVIAFGIGLLLGSRQ